MMYSSCNKKFNVYGLLAGGMSVENQHPFKRHENVAENSTFCFVPSSFCVIVLCELFLLL